MSFDDARPYRLAPKAIDDLDDIWRFSAETWSVTQADRFVDDLVYVFESIAALPTLARERAEFNPPVRIHMHQRHVVVYVIAADDVVVLRVLGGRQDWLAVLRTSES